MKQYSLIICIAFVTCLSACYKDTGNYDYKDINEITISGMATSYSAVLAVDTLRIAPNIKMTETISDPTRLAYYWILYKGTTALDTIGTEAKLAWPVQISPDSYIIYLRIIDKQTGVAWKAGTTLTVGTLYSTGLMLMGTDPNGNAEVDMISMVSDTNIIHGLLSGSGLPTLHDPVSIQHIGGKDTNSNNARVWVMTQSGSYYLDRKTMKGSTAKTFGGLVATTDNIDKSTLTPIMQVPQIRDRAGNLGNSYIRAMMTSDGNIFPSYSLLNGGDYYTNPINREESNFDKRIKTAPYLFYPIGNMSTIMWYDIEKDRFMNYASFGLAQVSVVPVDNAADIFPWNQAATVRKLVYGENTRNTDGGSTNGNSFAILKDNNNTFSIYKFYANSATPLKRDMYTVKPIATDFDKASFYAFSSRRTVVFYAVGKKLYAYDYNKGLEKLYEFPDLGTDDITMIKFDTQIDFATNALYIATYNESTKGRLRRFMVGTDPNTVTITPVNRSDWNGLIKIKDMNWRAVN